MTLTLHPMTSHWVDGVYRHDPTTHGIQAHPHPVADQTEAEETAVRWLQAYGAVSYVRLDDDGTEVRTYGRCDFFQWKSPLRDVRERVVAADLVARMAARVAERALSEVAHR